MGEKMSATQRKREKKFEKTMPGPWDRWRASELGESERAVALLEVRDVQLRRQRPTSTSSRPMVLTALSITVTIVLLVYKSTVENFEEVPDFVTYLPVFLIGGLGLLVAAIMFDDRRMDKKLRHVGAWVLLYEMSVDKTLGSQPRPPIPAPPVS